MDTLKYIAGYPEHVIEQVRQLIKNEKLSVYLHNKYPDAHQINNEKALYDYVQRLKNRYIKQASPISKVNFDPKLQLVKQALGTHTFVSRVQGGKLKAKKEIRIASLFKDAPAAMLEMIVVHELAHLKEKNHDKAFYKLCCYMQNDYHQVEFDTRLYLIAIDLGLDLN